MAQIAYILLCHRDPDTVVALAQSLTQAGDYVVVHCDARAPRSVFAALRAGLGDVPGVVFTPRRIRCGWGEWSLVAATLEGLRTGVSRFPDASHFFLISGECAPIKTAEHIRNALDAQPVDHIELNDFFDTNWIKTGWRDERLVYHHWFNERAQKPAFYAMYEVQRRLGLRKKLPRDLKIMIGAQWWCLRRETVEKLLAFVDARPDVLRFFKTTWIPDEIFFQTLVHHLVDADQIAPRAPTFLMFSDYGMPVTFHADHFDLLIGQPEFFARKISRHAETLRARLATLYGETGRAFGQAEDGRAVYAFLTGKGRVGQRFAPRFWETESTVGRDRELLIVVCKKYDLGKRLVGAARTVTGVATVDYLFNETDCPLPDLGGIERTMEKRHRHRRAVMRMLYDHFETDRLMICIDPEAFALLEDFDSDHATTRMLLIDCAFSDRWLTGHLHRTGLAGPDTPPDRMARLLQTLRNAIQHENEQILDARFQNLDRMRQGDPPIANLRALASFLGVDESTAHAILRGDAFFDDGDQQ